MKSTYIKESAVRKLCKQHGRRVSKEFIEFLNAYIENRVVFCCADHNGGRKTVDRAIAHYYMGSSER